MKAYTSKKLDLSFRARPNPRIEHRYYMYKDCKNKCKLGTSRLRGWLIGPFMHSLGSCLEQLKVCMEKPDTFPTEKIFLLNR